MYVGCGGNWDFLDQLMPIVCQNPFLFKFRYRFSDGQKMKSS